MLNGRVERRDGDLLAVRGSSADALAELLVGSGVRLAELQAERRTLEEVVLELTGPGSDRVARGRGQ